MDRAISSQLHVIEKDMQNYCLNRALSFYILQKKLRWLCDYVKLFLLVFRYRIPFCYLMYVIKKIILFLRV